MAQQIKKKFLAPEVVEYFDNQISAAEGSVVSEKERAEGAEQALDVKIEQEKLDRASGDLSTLTSANSHADSKVLEEKNLREAADTALDGRITTLEGQVGEDLQTAISELESSISSEATARQEADSSLQAQVDTEKGRIDAILSLSDADKDSFKEIVDLINSVDTENDQAFASYVLSNDSALAEEISRATSAESGLESRISAVESQVGEDLQSAISELDQKITTEKESREAADLSIQSEISAIQGSENVVFEDSAATYADGAAGIKDPSGRDGWYFKNNGDKINWYFFDGSKENVTVSQFENMYSVATVDAPLTSSDTFLMAYYTMPQGDGQDAGSWYRSRQVYVPNNSFERGVKSLFYVGAEPSADLYPGLPRVQMVISNIATVGPNGSSERLMTTVFGTNSGATPGKIELVVNKLGFKSSVFSAEYSLEIRGDFSLSGIKQSILEQSIELNSKISVEESARIAKDEQLESGITALEASVQEIQAKGFGKGSTVVGSELSFLDLDRQYETVLTVSVGRLSVHEGEDFTVSVVGGKTRITWIGSLVNPDGAEAIETGDKVFWSGAY